MGVMVSGMKIGGGGKSGVLSVEYGFMLVAMMVLKDDFDNGIVGGAE